MRRQRELLERVGKYAGPSCPSDPLAPPATQTGLLSAGRPGGLLPRPLMSVPVLSVCSCRRGEQHRAADSLCPVPTRARMPSSTGGGRGDSPQRDSTPSPGSAVWTPCGSREGRVTVSGELPGAPSIPAAPPVQVLLLPSLPRLQDSTNRVTEPLAVLLRGHPVCSPAPAPGPQPWL